MKIKGYDCVNAEKLNRAIYGAIGPNGKPVDGVTEAATDEAKLAEYDRLGGLILKGVRKVKMGSFWDFDKRKAREAADVKLVLSDLEGNQVEVGEDEALAPELIAAENIKAKKAEARAAKVAEREAKVAERKARAEERAARRNAKTE